MPSSTLNSRYPYFILPRCCGCCAHWVPLYWLHDKPVATRAACQLLYGTLASPACRRLETRQGSAQFSLIDAWWLLAICDIDFDYIGAETPRITFNFFRWRRATGIYRKMTPMLPAWLEWRWIFGETLRPTGYFAALMPMMTFPGQMPSRYFHSLLHISSH